MQQHIYYIKFALRFADMQIPELIKDVLVCEAITTALSSTSSSVGGSMSQSSITVKPSPSHIPSGTIFPTASWSPSAESPSQD